MNTHYIRLMTALFTLLITAAGVCAQTPLPVNQKQNQTVAFVSVNVVPMDRERVLFNQTVIIRDGRIAEMGPAQTIKVPDEALRIDCKMSLYLMPGLADMHTHLRYDEDLLLYVANGVTTVRNMRGGPEHLQWREKVKNKEMLGPAIYTAGPTLSGPNSGFTEVRTAADAEKIVVEQKKAGYDFIKVYDQLPKEAYEGVIAAAKRLKMPVAGHVPTEVGVEGVLKAGQASIEHAEQYIYHYFGDYNSFDLDKAKIPLIARETKKAETYVCPTLGIIENYILQVDDPKTLFGRVELKYTNPETLAYWYSQQRDSSAANKAINTFQKELIRGFRDAGVPMLSGTDIYAVGYIPGFSLHRELHSLVDAGLTPYQALETSTRNAGEFLNADFGTVAVGKRADLLLVTENPLEGIDNVSRRAGVMVQGRWIPDAELKLMLNDVEKSFARGQAFINLILDDKVDAVVQSFHDLHTNGKELIQSQRYVFDSMGRRLLRENKVKDAIKLFKLNVEGFPQSARVYDSLADAYLIDGSKEPAIKNYQKSLEIDPNNTNVKEKLAKLL